MSGRVECRGAGAWRDARKQPEGCTDIRAYRSGQREGAFVPGRDGRGFVMVKAGCAGGIADMDNAQPPGGPADFDQGRTAAAHLPAFDDHELHPHERPHPDREAGQQGGYLGAGHGGSIGAQAGGGENGGGMWRGDWGKGAESGAYPPPRTGEDEGGA